MSGSLQAATLNNLSIYYVRSGMPKSALRCLRQVVTLGSDAKTVHTLIHVSLNMSTVLADLGRHEEALEAAQETPQLASFTASTPPSQHLCTFAPHPSLAARRPAC